MWKILMKEFYTCLAKYTGKGLSRQYKFYEQTKLQGPKLAIDKL